jgi:hypothetical protein
MAGTDFTDIFDRFMMLQADYRLIALYQSSVNDFNSYLEGWILFAIEEFDEICDQSLAYSGSSFTESLTNESISILAQLMVKYWMMHEVQDVLQMNMFIKDRDFDIHSAAQNLREKQSMLTNKKEEISQLLVDYGYKYNDWTSWSLQNFEGA